MIIENSEIGYLQGKNAERAHSGKVFPCAFAADTQTSRPGELDVGELDVLVNWTEQNQTGESGLRNSFRHIPTSGFPRLLKPARRGAPHFSFLYWFPAYASEIPQANPFRVSGNSRTRFPVAA